MPLFIRVENFSVTTISVFPCLLNVGSIEGPVSCTENEKNKYIYIYI